MYEVRLYSGFRHVGDVCVSTNAIKKTMIVGTGCVGREWHRHSIYLGHIIITDGTECMHFFSEDRHDSIESIKEAIDREESCKENKGN